jgi:alpha-tubulin suppressor-like RCC1 family protein
LSNVVGVAGGELHSLAVKSDGTVVAWGAGTTDRGTWPDYGQSIIPPGLNDAISVAAGSLHSIALRRDGHVLVWGDGGGGQKKVPAGLSSVASIAAGGYCSLALRSNGTVVAWGSGPTNVPAGLGGVVAVTTGGGHCLALKGDGTVLGWGLGSTNTGQYPNYGQAITTGLANVIAVAAGTDQSGVIQAEFQIHSLELLGLDARIGFRSFTGRQYSLDFSTNLDAASWVPVAGMDSNGTGGDVLMIHTNAASIWPRSFYRVREQ